VAPAFAQGQPPGPRGVTDRPLTAEQDRARVSAQLGREPRGAFEVVVRDRNGDPLVTPMPTRYWLVGEHEKKAVDRLEAAGGVRRAEAAVGPAELRCAHRAYAAEREQAVPPGWSGPRPAGGVAGTRTGVKCLHAHYAWFLAGGRDPVGAWVAAQLNGGRPAAAIDCGTNSTRLLVARPGGPALERLMRITRLGEGVDGERRLAPAAIERTLEVLRYYRTVMDRFDVGEVRMTATSAARDAINRDEFFDAAEAVLGVRPELLRGEEEGRLSFAGATAQLDPGTGPWLVVDIGGGSTELVAGPGPDGGPRAVRSLEVGCVRLTERFFSADPPDPRSLAAARAYTDGLLERASSEAPDLTGTAGMVGLAGTVACLAAMDQAITSYDRDRVHHYRLRIDRVEEMLAVLAATDSDGRRELPGVEAERADVIVAGALVLAAVMRCFGFDECLTSEADILDGLVLSMAAGPADRL
jgi:exopolyphosphatase/guanosine-5'-triphosphate,3'-diphosphate pyrophosphatase